MPQADLGDGDARRLSGLPRHLSWQIFPLVGGLFVLVAGAEKVDAAGLAEAWLAAPRGRVDGLGAAWLVGLLCKLADNLPLGLLVGLAAMPLPLMLTLLSRLTWRRPASSGRCAPGPCRWRRWLPCCPA